MTTLTHHSRRLAAVLVGALMLTAAAVSTLEPSNSTTVSTPAPVVGVAATTEWIAQAQK